MIERTPLLLETKKLAFKGGIHNRHTPRERAWLPIHLRPTHHEAPRRTAPEPKPRRAGDPLRDEPLRTGLEAKARENRRRLKRKAAKHQFSDVDLSRTELLLDHDKPT